MIAALCIVFKMGIQKIGEEEDLQDHKQDEKFDHYNQPGLFTPFGHVGKSLFIKQEYFFYEYHSNYYKPLQYLTSKVKLYFHIIGDYQNKIKNIYSVLQIQL